MYLWREKAPVRNRTHKRGDKEADNNVVIQQFLSNSQYPSRSDINDLQNELTQ